MLQSLLLIAHVLIAVCLLALILVQQGKGADMGAAFGSGASGTVFGSQGSGNFLVRLTSLFAVGFFVTSISLGYFANKQLKHAQRLTVPAVPTVPMKHGSSKK